MDFSLKTPLVSIALAVYNGEKYLLELLQSVANQSYKNIEFVILNDASTDLSEEIIKNFSRNYKVHYFKNESNIGVIASFKKLLKHCSGDFVAFCDQDDIWMTDKIEICLNKAMEFQNELEPFAVFSDLAMINANGVIIEPSFLKHHNVNPEIYSFQKILKNNIVTGCTLLINNKMKTELLTMPNNIMMHDYWVALIAYSFGNHYYIDKQLVLYRQHSNSVTTKLKRNKFRMLLYIFSDFKKDIQKKRNQAKLFYQQYSHKLSKKDVNGIRRFIFRNAFSSI